ncbi:phenylacetate--CoA ligase family protein [Planctomycetota bacterium]
MNWRKPIIFGLLHAAGRKIPAHLHAMETQEFEDAASLKQRQEQKLTQLLIHAYEQVPYYQEVLAEVGVVQGGQVYLERFSRLPILTKKVIREQGERLYARDRDARKPYPNTSGGSTGEPLAFLQDRNYDDWNIATKLYFNRMLGKDVGEGEIKLWGSDRDILAGNLTWKERFTNQLYNRRFFNCYRFGDEERAELVDLNNQFKPHAYWSYMEAAHELARYLEQHPAAFTSPAIVISTIGPLTTEVKDKIESQLGCKVYNQYGSREVGAIACQCPEQQGLHTFPWWSWVEVVDEVGMSIDQGVGRVVVTTLENYSMPLIRYDIGDVAVAGGHDCACRRKSFMLNEVKGRTLGFFKKADGSLAHSHFLVQALFFRDWIKRFQIVQDALDHVLIRIERETSEETPKMELEDIRQKTQVLMGSSCEVEFAFVDRIERSASGKYIYTQCLVE